MYRPCLFQGLHRSLCPARICFQILLTSLRRDVRLVLLSLCCVRDFVAAPSCMLQERGRTSEQTDSLQLQEARAWAQGSCVRGAEGDIRKRGEGCRYSQLVEKSPRLRPSSKVPSRMRIRAVYPHPHPCEVYVV